MAGRRLAGVLCTMVAVLVATAALSGAAVSRHPTGIPNRFCSGGFQARGELWGFDGRNISCHWQRPWAIRFVRQGQAPQHWRCLDTGDSGRCHRRHTYDPSHRHNWFEFYAQD